MVDVVKRSTGTRVVIAIAIFMTTTFLPSITVMAGEFPNPPYKLVRELSILQNKIAHGSKAAHRAQRALIRKIRVRLEHEKDDAWSDPRNVRAVIRFAMSGGGAEVLKKLAKNDFLNEDYRDLGLGILAYSSGRNAEAASYLNKVDVFKLSRSVGSHTALIKGLIWRSKNPDRAMKYFNRARLLAPGTLVEEAALRRQIPMVTGYKNTKKFESLSARYFRRFGKSAYAPGLFKDLTRFTIKNSPRLTGHHTDHLEKIFKKISDEERLKIFLNIARGSVVRGGVYIAEWASKKIPDLAQDQPDILNRAQFYKGASLVLSEEFDVGLELLMGVDKSKLHRNDRSLIEAVFSVAQYIRSQPMAPADLENPPKIESYTTQKFPKVAATMDNAERMILGTDAFLKEVIK